MQSFLVVRQRSEWARRNVVERITRLALDRLVFVPKDVFLYDHPEQRTVVFLADAGGAPDLGPWLHRSPGGGFLAHAGTPLLPPGEGAVRDLFEALTLKGPDEVFEALRGTFALAALLPGGTISAFGDFAGLTPLFWSSTPDAVAVSNRQSLLPVACTRLDRPVHDLGPLSWLPDQANVFGDDGVVHGTRLLRPGNLLTVGPDDEVSVRPLARPFWDSDPDQPVDYDHVFDSLVQNFRALGALTAQELSLSLTGGKDSRLNLALACAAGLSDRLRLFTNGPEGSPEIECAAALAQTFGLPHEARVTAPQAFEPANVWDRLRHHVHRFEGVVCPWDGLGSTTRQTSFEVNGMGGEIYRTHAKHLKNVEFRDADHAKELFRNYQQPRDPLGVLSEARRREHDRWLDGWIDEQLARGVALQDLADAFYVQWRLPLWSGQLGANTPAKLRYYPLADRVAARAVFGGRRHLRRTERLHFEMMRRVDRRFVRFPFLADRWDKSLFAWRVNRPLPYRSEQPPTTRALTSWQWQFLESERDTIAELLLGSPSSGLLDICDREALETAVRRMDQLRGVPSAKEVLSLVGIALLLTGGATTARDVLMDDLRDQRVHSNVDAIRFAGMGDPRPISALLAIDDPLVAAARSFRASDRDAARVGREVAGLLEASGVRSAFGDSSPRFPRGAGERLGLPVVQVPLPHRGPLRRLRVDPGDRPGELLLGEISLTVDGVTRTVDGRVPDDLTLNRWLGHRGTHGGKGLYEATGEDPWFLVSPFADVDLTGAQEVLLNIEVLSANAERLEVFWDDGGGFTQACKARADLHPTPLSRLLALAVLAGPESPGPGLPGAQRRG